MGVAIPRQHDSAAAARSEFLSLAVIGGGREVESYRIVLAAVRQFLGANPQVQIFMELRGPGEHQIWRHAQRLGLLELLSTFSNSWHHRSLLTRCDVLLVPEADAEVRSLVLEAMAHALPVVVADGRQTDAIRAGETAIVVTERSESAWAGAMQALAANRDMAARIGGAARAEVAARNRSSQQVSRLLETLLRTVHGESYVFDRSRVAP
jgi:glycosyltransferase involved in cell wall biosynthesis